MVGFFSKVSSRFSRSDSNRYYGDSSLDAQFNTVLKSLELLKNSFGNNKSLEELFEDLDFGFLELRKNPVRDNPVLGLINSYFSSYDAIKHGTFERNSELENLKGHYSNILKLLK